MSNYFQYFPRSFYRFGDETRSDVFQNITIYADVIDQVKDNTTIYTDYYIQDNERPDQASFNIYGNTNFHWTFYLMNNKLREQGWPLSRSNVLRYAQKKYPNKTITTRTGLTSLTGFFKTGDTIEGRTSGATAKIDHRHLDLGQLVINVTSGTFQAGELLQMSGTSDTVSVHSVSDEYLSAHHYEDASKVITDIDPTVGPGALLNEVTYLDRAHSENDNLKQIRIIKPSLITDVVNSFREAVAG
jgi:hypothetical protein